MKRTFFCLWLFLYCLSAAAQTSHPLVTGYVDAHNILKENSYAQLNKAVFLAGEHLWFKIYITDVKTGLLSFRTNKVYTDLYAPDGSLYTRKIWHVRDGCAYGQINLSDTLAGGDFTFKAYTSWQQNFEPERMFSAQIQIKSFDTYADSASTSATLSWNIQCFPEGGDLIAGTTARIAVKGVDPNGKGRPIRGTIVSTASDTLAFFETNTLGMGSFVLPPEYSGLDGLQAVVLLPDGQTDYIPLPRPKALGVSLQLNALGKENVDIFLNTNPATLQTLADQPFYCMVHQNGVVTELFTISTLDRPLLKLQLPKAYLPAGVNTVTLFDAAFKPIAERLFFAEKEEALGVVDITAVRIRDTIEVRIKTIDAAGNLVPGLLSASVLPAATKAGDFTGNMYTQFLLSADLRGEVETPLYYFQERSLERLQALDNLLMTQAWRKYAWNTLLTEKKTPQLFPYPFEYGFELSGKAMRQSLLGNRTSSKSEVVLNMSGEPFTKYAEVAPDGSFLFDSLLIFKPYNQLLLIAMDQEGSAGNRHLREVAVLTSALNNRIHPKPTVSHEKDAEAGEQPDEEEWLRFIDPNATTLSAAVVTATRVRARDIMVTDPFVSNLDKIYQVTEDDLGFYRTAMDVLQYKFGYQFIRDEDYNLLTKGKRRVTTMETVMEAKDDFNLYPPPKLIIDGVPMRDWAILDLIDAENIEAISEHLGPNVVLGADGMFGSVSIKTRGRSLITRDGPRNFAQLTVEGFEAPVAYYIPSYSNIPNKTYLTNYTCLHWAPDLIAPEGACIFRFPAAGAPQGLRIRVEGIAADGMLFSRDAEVTIPSLP